MQKEGPKGLTPKGHLQPASSHHLCPRIWERVQHSPHPSTLLLLTKFLITILSLIVH